MQCGIEAAGLHVSDDGLDEFFPLQAERSQTRQDGSVVIFYGAEVRVEDSRAEVTRSRAQRFCGERGCVCGRVMDEAKWPGTSCDASWEGKRGPGEIDEADLVVG